MPLHVLRHIETNQLDAQHLGQLFGDFCFTNTGRPGKQEGTFGFFRRLQASAGKLDGRGQRLNRRVLAEYHHLEIAFQITQQVFVAGGDVLRRNPRNVGHHVFDVRHLDGALTLIFRLQSLPCAGFVNHVNGLVRQVAIGDVPVCQLGGNPQSLVGVGQVVVLLKVRLEPFQDLVGILNAGLVDVDLLETPGQGTVFFENATELLERGGTNAP